MMAKQVRPWLAKPAHCEAHQVHHLVGGANQHIPSGTSALPNLKSECTGAIFTYPPASRKLGKKGASMYAMTN
jgi:hypothetical protein